MKTVVLKIDDNIYTQVINFLQLLPEKQFSIIEKQQSKPIENSLNITSSFGLISTPITANLEELKEAVAKGAINDSY